MNQILDKIAFYEDDELWDIYGDDEIVALIRSKPAIDWNATAEQIVSYEPIVVSRLLEAVYFLNDDSLNKLISAIAKICSDDNIEDIFYFINDQRASMLSKDDLRIILTRMESQNSRMRNTKTYKEIVNRILHRLSQNDE